ncbi:hypothetical protein [Promicromonospora panici]|uniref:hypothetical protein n=1 Tax=Promicromonospora panici TaxID=2219658 RepID=UPI00101D4990|nr:hypothetical protein [Promicromonospora panici]
MQELVGRLTALDPEASETLKVVAYFDVLVAGGVGLQALLRGAAVLSGAVAGAFDGRRTYRIGPDGGRLADRTTSDGTAAQQQWPTRTINNGRVWLEREGTPHANDEMVIERLALAVDLVGARGPGRHGSALEIAVDAARDVAERRIALSRLRLDPARETRIAALPLSHDPGTALPTAASTVVATPYGLVRAVILGRDATISGPAGVGVARRGDQLPESFRTALLALRLLPANDAVVDAAELGVVLAAVSALEPVAALEPDVAALARLDARARAVLDELAAAESVRAAATALGMHHSTLQARHDTLTSELGYDPRTLDGRARYRLARLLLRLVENH